MTAEQLKLYRRKAGLTQAEAAARLGVSQPYLSLLEHGRRAVTRKLARAVVKLYELPPTALPVSNDPPDVPRAEEQVRRQLAALGYPGYSYLRSAARVNPAEVVFRVVADDEVDARVTESLPWLLVRYPDLDWDWLVSRAKLRDVQNRLGFLVSVGRELAETRPAWTRSASHLAKVEEQLERARLVAETTLSREKMPPAEREWLRSNRSAKASHWNVLTSMTADQLRYGRDAG